ncbi:MAG: hypothetical protein RLZZ272_701 [Actinomycetota bacterium]|jgi:competence protein ComEA
MRPSPTSERGPDPDWGEDDDERPIERALAWLVPGAGEARGLVVVLVLALVVTAALLVGALRRGAEAPASDPAVVAAATALPRLTEDGALGPEPMTDEADGGTSVPVEVVVHVTGAVARPGLVRLEPGARIGDAVEAAGGLAPDADLARVNLARALVDGEHVHVLAVGEEALPAIPGAAGGGAGGIDAAGSGPGAVGAEGRLDVNRASVEELVVLPGIGPAKAAAIVQDRERNGPFQRPEDLQRVGGIGAATYAAIADLITVG